MRKGAELRTGCELVACGPVQVDTGMWVQSSEGTWAGDTAWELTEVDTWRVQGESYGKQTELEDMGIWGKADV